MPFSSALSRATATTNQTTDATQIFLQHPLYFVTGEKWSQGRSDEEIVHQVLRGGVRIIQLRDKESAFAIKLKKAHALRTLTRSFGALLLINDDPALALEVGADGVHLGQNDMPVAEARAMTTGGNQQKLFIGLSTHNQLEVKTALEATGDSRPDYINIGPLFPTTTKDNQYPPLAGGGAWRENPQPELSELQGLITFINHHETPMLFSVMGGIKARHLPALARVGVRTFAMISEITRHPNPEAQVRNLTAIINNV